MTKAEKINKDLESFANASVQVFSSFLKERKYRLVEINPHPDHSAVIKHLLAPVNLNHVTVFSDNEVVLYVGYDDQIRITEEEWNRIKLHFGYLDSKSKPEQEKPREENE